MAKITILDGGKMVGFQIKDTEEDRAQGKKVFARVPLPPESFIEAVAIVRSNCPHAAGRIPSVSARESSLMSLVGNVSPESTFETHGTTSNPQPHTMPDTLQLIVGETPPPPPLSATDDLRTSLVGSLQDAYLSERPIAALFDVLLPYLTAGPEHARLARCFEVVKTVNAIKQPYLLRIDQLERDAAAHTAILEEARNAHKAQLDQLRGEHQNQLLQLEGQHEKQLMVVKEGNDAAMSKLQKSLEHTETELLCLQEQINRKGTVNIFDGSITRAELWKKVIANVDERDLHRRLPSVPIALSPSERSKVADFLRRFNAKTWTREGPAFYKAVLALMRPMVNAPRLGDKIPGIELLDTHARKDLFANTCTPDLVISTAGQRKALAHALYGIMELKICEDDELETATHLGQAYDYLCRVQKAQPERRKFFAVLSNVRKNVIITLEKTFVAKYCAVDLRTLILYLRHALAPQTGVSDFKPPPFVFSLPSEDFTRLLGSSNRNVVAAFKFEGKVIAVKRTTEAFKIGVAHEIAILRRIMCTSGRPLSLPALEYALPDGHEFGMTPVGQPFTLASLPSATAMQDTLRDILSGLQWLHSIGIIHRDVRLDNVVMHTHDRSLRPTIIDFDHAVHFKPGKPEEVNYRGGLICCPPDLVCNPQFDITSDTYVPLPRHDFQAFVLLVLQCLFPSRFKGFRSYRLMQRSSEERKELINLWGELKASVVWSRFVAEVMDRDDVDCGLLEQMAQVYLFPKRVTR
ncbi:hypothetical protein FN846DRAFT_998815 [Sphaerosporella brunnea]|uniref:EKC/KEOPS complex subunit BUD32 n=1 Tax=Sphaerosporella brunnea TaxID=1250544 RepID=A0A5J5EI49_9PEZI|nr:hypothetical protein FN846DRAFT_998815 [Sphaerosporella brunnea]